jgi:hypothetical protein
LIIEMSTLILSKQVCDQLQRVFQGFEDAGIDPFFILMGPFVTKSATVSGGREVVTTAFAGLADVIASCSRISQNAKFLIVPGELPHYLYPLILHDTT